ncbi:HXXEE domain-containing protein [Methanobacterium alcaliphilum]|uniref:HXXEE domain-containing protein n=1 Tax=Methanobacterium alcaliphilum TaxID=392018 RepID=UPI00200AB084|nr:HXXEE domain-containing protein [Methanobacterium alcaliphilum]MCK9151404.1 HXXEE domain-containing protein [Methanobacterium alcaliphilum]
MLCKLLERTNLGRIMWLLPIIFFIHDMEEYLTMSSFMAHNSILSSIPLFEMLKTTSAQFMVSIIFLTILVVVVTYFAIKKREGNILKLYLLVVVLIFVNAIIHIFQGLYLNSYVPGLITAIALVIPYCLWIFCIFYHEKVLNNRLMLMFVALSFPLQIPLIMIALWLGKTLIPF